MTEDLKRRYREKVAELLFLRENEGGTLPVEVESAYVAQLEDLWWRLSEHEQQALEDGLKVLPSSTAPERLPLIDSPVQLGGAELPREVLEPRVHGALSRTRAEVARIEARTAWNDWGEEELASELSSEQNSLVGR